MAGAAGGCGRNSCSESVSRIAQGGEGGGSAPVLHKQEGSLAAGRPRRVGPLAVGEIEDTLQLAQRPFFLQLGNARERGAEIRPAAPVQRQRGGVALPFFGAVQKGQLAHRVVALHHGDVAAVKKAPACAQDAERLAQKRLDERPGRRFARVDHNHQVADLAALPRLQRFDQRQVAVGAQAVGIGAQVELVGVEPGLLAHNGEPAQKIPVRPAAAGGFHLGGQRLRAGSLPGLAARLLHAQLGLAAQLFPLPPHHLGGGGLRVGGPQAVAVAVKFPLQNLQLAGAARAQRAVNGPGGRQAGGFMQLGIGFLP